MLCKLDLQAIDHIHVMPVLIAYVLYLLRFKERVQYTLLVACIAPRHWSTNAYYRNKAIRYLRRKNGIVVIKTRMLNGVHAESQEVGHTC